MHALIPFSVLAWGTFLTKLEGNPGMPQRGLPPRGGTEACANACA